MKFFRDAWPVVVIVATVAGAAWTAAWTLRDFLAARIATSETGLAAQIAASENRLAAQIAAGENRLAAQIAASENRLAENDAHLAEQIAELRQYLVDHLGDHAGRGATPALARGAMLRTEERAGWTQRQAAADDECPRGPGADADDHRRRRPCPLQHPRARPPGRAGR